MYTQNNDTSRNERTEVNEVLLHTCGQSIRKVALIVELLGVFNCWTQTAGDSEVLVVAFVLKTVLGNKKKSYGRMLVGLCFYI